MGISLRHLSHGSGRRPEPKPAATPDEVVAATIVAAATEVHGALGPGCERSVYEEALSAEMEIRGLTIERAYPFTFEYKGRVVGHGRLDFFVAGRVGILLLPIDAANGDRLSSSLKAMGLTVGVLLHFESRALGYCQVGGAP